MRNMLGRRRQPSQPQHLFVVFAFGRRGSGYLDLFFSFICVGFWFLFVVFLGRSPSQSDAPSLRDSAQFSRLPPAARLMNDFGSPP